VIFIIIVTMTVSEATGAGTDALLAVTDEKHWPNETLQQGFPPKAVANTPATNAGLPPIPEFAIPSQHPGSFPPYGGPAAAGSISIPNMYPAHAIRGYAAFSSMLQTLSALNVLRDASSQAVSILKGNTALRVRATDAFNEAVQMDPDPTTRLMLKQLQAQSQRLSAKSERFLHGIAVAVRQAELAVESMKEQMGGVLDLDEDAGGVLSAGMEKGFGVGGAGGADEAGFRGRILPSERMGLGKDTLHNPKKGVGGLMDFGMPTALR